MRNLLSFIFLSSLIVGAAAQSPSPPPPPSSTPTPSDRPTLNRPGSSNTGLGSATTTPTPYSSPAAQPAQAETNGEPPKPSYPDLLPRFDYDSHAGIEMRETAVQKRDNRSEE